MALDEPPEVPTVTTGASRSAESYQPLGEPVPGWVARPAPPGQVLIGDHCRLEVLTDVHVADLVAAYRLDAADEGWTYLPFGPLHTVEEYRAWLAVATEAADSLFYVVLDPAGLPVGVAAYLRIQPDVGSIEVGNVHFSPLLQRRAAATEAQYLLMRHAFDDLGYRRYEWKCNALNAPSRATALRLGFHYEGTFRQAAVVKGRNRDTAWYSIIDREWPVVRAGFEAWLDAANFDSDGRQSRRLHQLRAEPGRLRA